MTHLKTYNAPKRWNILRKENVFITRPKPGAHTQELAIPLSVILKQQGFAKTTREVKHIINQKTVTVDGKPITDHHKTVGFMDTINIGSEKNMRCTLDKKGRLTFTTITPEEAKKKICKITGKKTIKGNNIQLQLNDGRTLLAENKYNVGDSILIEVPSQKIIDHFKLTKENTVFFMGGAHTGYTGKIQNIEKEKIWCTLEDKQIETKIHFAIAIGKDKPVITL